MSNTKNYKSLDINYLRTLCESTGVSGFEKEVCEGFLSYLGNEVADAHLDAMGNAIAFLKGDNKTVMIEAHADEIGFQVIHISDTGNIHIRANGGIDEQCLPGSQVVIQTQSRGLLPGVIGKKPIHLMKADDRKHTIETHHLWVDTGLSPEEVKSAIDIGDPVAFVPNMKLLGDYRVSSKALDDRVGVFVVAQTMKRLALTSSQVHTIAGVATVQEEVGCRGSVTASYSIHPDIAITVDVDFATDVPDCPSAQYGAINLGAGVVIPRNADADMALSRHMEQIAKDKGIPYQISARHRTTGGTNASKIQLTRDGVHTISLGIPCRYMHTPVEMCDLRDIEAAIQLMVEFCQS